MRTVLTVPLLGAALLTVGAALAVRFRCLRAAPRPPRASAPTPGELLDRLRSKGF